MWIGEIYCSHNIQLQWKTSQRLSSRQVVQNGIWGITSICHGPTTQSYRFEHYRHVNWLDMGNSGFSECVCDLVRPGFTDSVWNPSFYRKTMNDRRERNLTAGCRGESDVYVANRRRSASKHELRPKMSPFDRTRSPIRAWSIEMTARASDRSKV